MPSLKNISSKSMINKKSAFVKLSFRALLPRFVAEVVLEFIGFALPFVGVGGRGFLAGDVGPFGGIFAVHLQPFFGFLVGVGNDRLRRTFGFAHAAVDAFFGADDQHVLALVKTVDGANLDAIHIFAADTGFGNDVRHSVNSTFGQAVSLHKQETLRWQGPPALKLRWVKALALRSLGEGGGVTRA